MSIFWVLVAACAWRPPTVTAAPLQVRVDPVHIRAQLGVDDGALRLEVPPRLSRLRSALGLGVTGEGATRTVRFAGLFLPWTEGARVRWLEGQTELATGRTDLWVTDREVATGQLSRCLYATGQGVSVRRDDGRQLVLDTQLDVTGHCAAPAPALDCAAAPIEVAGPGLIRLPEGPGLLDPVMNGETEAQERGWIQPVVASALLDAARRTACASADWPGTGWPLVVGDRSLADGSIPSWQGVPAHPEGSHTDGWDADVSYFQAGYAPDNDMRPVCVHVDEQGDHQHCLGAPVLLDVKRTALFVGLLANSPHVACVGVDGQIGPRLLQAQAELVDEGRLPRVRSDKLCFETRDRGRGWYRGHHDHLHVQGARP